MVTAVGIPGYNAGVPSSSYLPSRGSSVGALEGQIRQDQIELNDWTTCVSAKTPKGQAAIEKLSGEISADKAHIARTLQAQSGTSSAAPASGSVDVWA